MRRPHRGEFAGTPSISWLWAAVPIATLGLGSAVPFVFAAIRFRSRAFALSGAAYAALAFLALYLLNAGPQSSWQARVGAGFALTSACVGAAHVLAVRRPSLVSRWRTFEPRGEGARQRAVERLRRRQEARQIVAQDPVLADELRIGRPDLPREYDDGGLVDVNHVPAPVLAQLPDIREEIAQKIVSTREAIARFESVDDLSVTTGLPPQTFDHLKD